MGVYIWNRLPSEYQEVEYIQSSGTQHINTGYEPNSNTEVECKINMASITNTWDSIYGATNTSSGASKRAFLLQIQKSTSKMYATIYSNYGSYQISISSASGISTNTDYTIKQSNTNFYIDGVSQGTYSSSSYTVPYNMNIFSYNEGGTSTSGVSMKLYYTKIWDSGTLVRDFVPCYRKSDSVIGLYDLVNNQFYTNSGTGTFSKGSDVNTYRESSLKNAYIGEYKLNLVFDFSIDTGFGSYTYTNTGGNGLTIQNNNGWVTNNGSHGNGFVWKTVNAKKVWTRVLWNMANVSISGDNGGGLGLGVFAGNGGIPSNSGYVTEQQCYNSSKSLRLSVKGTRVALETFNVNLGTDYYMDFKFENGVYTCEILDTNLNVLKTETYTSTDTTCNYVGFAMWNYGQTNFCRIKKYWEYYVE